MHIPSNLCIYFTGVASIFSSLSWAAKPESPPKPPSKSSCALAFQFLRFKDFPTPPDAIYIENQFRAQKVFMNWFLTSKIDVHEFESLLKKAHRAALRKKYEAQELGGVLNLGTTSVKAGKLRDFSPMIHWERGALQQEGHLVDPTSNPSYHVVDENLRRWTPEFKGIPEEARPKLDTYTVRPGRPQESYEEYRVWYPNSKFIPIYFQRMSEVLADIQTISPDMVKRSPQASRRFLALTAEYYQLGVAAHPFDGVNNSLFMGQINGLLQYYHFEPISHGYLDFLSLSVSTNKFADIFASRILPQGAHP